MINVGIIGSGFIVPEFIKATSLVKGYHYRGIASPVEEQLKNLKEKYSEKLLEEEFKKRENLKGNSEELSVKANCRSFVVTTKTSGSFTVANRGLFGTLKLSDYVCCGRIIF